MVEFCLQNRNYFAHISAIFVLLLSVPTIAIYYDYSAQKLIVIYHPTQTRRLSLARHGSF